MTKIDSPLRRRIVLLPALAALAAVAAAAVLYEAAQPAGKAASDPLFPDDPTLPGNRRIAIVLLRDKPVLPPDHQP